MSFKEQVYTVVKKIPKGSVLTYKQVAEIVGHPGAARAVGSVLKQNFDKTIPCHRVIRSDGVLGDYNRSRGEKMKKLKAEGYIK